MLVRTRLGDPYGTIPARIEAFPVWSFLGCVAGRDNHLRIRPHQTT